MINKVKYKEHIEKMSKDNLIVDKKLFNLYFFNFSKNLFILTFLQIIQNYPLFQNFFPQNWSFICDFIIILKFAPTAIKLSLLL